MLKNKLEKVTIIVSNYNGKAFLEDCFTSMKKLDYPSFDVIMTDDCSTDSSVEYVKKNFPWVKVIANKKNLGVPISFNNAVKQSKTELLVKVDNDVTFDKEWLKKMVETLNNDAKIGVVGSLILNYGEKDVQDIGSNIDMFGYQMNYTTLDGLPKKEEKLKEVFYVSGCSMLFRKNIFEKAGGFDEEYFLYKDDLDLCWRIKMLDFKIVTDLESKIYHKSGVTAGGQIKLDQKGKYHTSAKKRFFGERNTLRTLLKNYSTISLIKVLPFYFLIALGETIVFCLIGRFDVSKSYFNAILWNIKNFSGTIRLRKKIQTIRVVSDKEIMKNKINGSSKLNYLRSIGLPEFS